MEVEFLEHLVVGSFARLTKLARSVHPSPEILGHGDDVVGNVGENGK